MKSALLVIDVQKSFTQRSYWREEGVASFLNRTQTLIDRFHHARAPVLQVFHVEEGHGAAEPFSRASGLVETLSGLSVNPAATFYKSVHSAMFATDAAGRSLDAWLRARDIERLVVTGIRTEQCCETTTRHASDLGYKVTYAMDATLTFPMLSGSGRWYTADEIRERTELVLAGRFAEVVAAESVRA